MRLLGLLALAAIAAGCGGLSESDYTDRVIKASEAVQVAIAGAGSQASQLEASSRSIARAADDLDGAEPPGEAKRLNARLVGGFRQLARTFHAAAEAARTGDFAKRDDILEHLDQSPGLRQLEAAERELDKLG